MDVVLVSFLLTFTPLLGLFWLGIREERRKQQMLYRLAILTVTRQQQRRTKR